LFEELAQNQGDLRLFLGLHFGFYKFFRTLAADFFEKSLGPALKARADNRKLTPSPNISLPDVNGDWLTIASPGRWPEGWGVAWGSEQYRAKQVYVQIVVPAEAERAKFEELKPRLIETMKQKFPEEKIEANPKSVWFYYSASSPYRNWETEDAVLKLVQDVAAVKGGAQPDAAGSFAGRYVEDLLALTEIVDGVLTVR
jgi:hypothetical protein